MKISNYENVLHRDERLRKCARIAKAIIGVTDEQAEALISGLHDHKGTLIVAWVFDPTPHQKAAFQTAWEMCSEHHVRHLVGRDAREAV